MARARNIKPGFFQNDELADLHPLERLAFIGMWTIADFKGCIEYRPKMLKVQILPYDECDMEVITNNLEQARFIRSYSVQGKRYLKIVNFEKHQNPHKNEREAGSEIPDIGEKDEIGNKNSELSKDGTKPDLIGTARADSLVLIPDSLIQEKPPVEKPQTAPPESKKKSPVTLRRFLDECRERNELPIPEDDPIFNNAERENIAPDLLHLCWLEFRDQHLNLNIRGTRKQADWRATFRSCVRGNWYGLWYTSADGSVTLTSKGHAAMLRHREAA